MNISLLIVEDDALIAENLRLTLEDLGYAVLAVCCTYAEATEAFLDHRPDLVLLDINLGSAYPGRDGLALAQQLSQQPTPPPFVFLTAYNDLDTIRKATRLAPSGYLIKPVNGATLFAAIQTAIESHRTRQPAALPPSPAAAAAPPEPPPYFFVKVGEQTHRLLWADVSVIEAGKNYVTLRDAPSGRGYPIRGSLAYVLDSLVPAALRGQFVRVGRSLALNAATVTAYDDEFIHCGPDRYESTPATARLLRELVK